MNYWKYMSSVLLFTLFSCNFLEGEVKLHSDGECMRVLFDNLKEDIDSAYIRNAFGLKIAKDYDCWNKSAVRLRTLGKRIDDNRLMDLVHWILLGDVYKDFYTKRRKVGVNIEPNEHYPCQLIPIYAEQTGQALLSVGSERGFIGAALSKASSLYLVDYTPDITVYNYIVLLLLKASDNQLDYLYLRKEASCEEWIHAFSSKNIEIKGSLEHHVPYLWQFWDKNARSSEMEVNNTEVIPYYYPSGTEFVVNLQGFANANYLFNEDLFKWIKSLADRDRVFIYLADVSNYEQLKEVRNDIYPEKFGIIDLSNIIDIDEEKHAFDSRYLDELEHQNCFKALYEATDEKTYLVWTSWRSVKNDCLKRLKQLKLERGVWTYRAVQLHQALSFSLRESSTLDIWRSELTSFEGCRTDANQVSLIDRMMNKLFIGFTDTMNRLDWSLQQ